MVAYIDLIIIENFCMNILILYTTGKLLNRKIKKGRLALAGLLGDLYTFSLYINVPNYIINISKVIVGALLLKICFGTNNWKGFTKELLIFFMVSFVYAGCALAFVYLAKPKVIYIVNGVIIGGEYIFELVLSSAVVSFILIKLGSKLINWKQKFYKKDMICRMYVYYKKNVFL